MPLSTMGQEKAFFARKEPEIRAFLEDAKIRAATGVAESRAQPDYPETDPLGDYYLSIPLIEQALEALKTETDVNVINDLLTTLNTALIKIQAINAFFNAEGPYLVLKLLTRFTDEGSKYCAMFHSDLYSLAITGVTLPETFDFKDFAAGNLIYVESNYLVELTENISLHFPNLGILNLATTEPREGVLKLPSLATLDKGKLQVHLSGLKIDRFPDMPRGAKVLQLTLAGNEHAFPKETPGFLLTADPMHLIGIQVEKLGRNMIKTDDQYQAFYQQHVAPKLQAGSSSTAAMADPVMAPAPVATPAAVRHD